MLRPGQLDELGRKVLDSLPDGLDVLSEDLRHNIRAGIAASLARMDLVTRQEFDVQRAVLLRTRERLEALERRVRELEAALASESRPKPQPKPPGD